MLYKYKLIVQVEYVSFGIQKWKTATASNNGDAKRSCVRVNPQRAALHKGVSGEKEHTKQNGPSSQTN